MKQIARKISTYTADVSGVCSALYELGGMVVMHDPSGCNSTYNTHDEPRWYHMDSLIFISGLAEIDAIMGNDEKLIDDIVVAAKQLSPQFIALARTPIPMMNGTDFDAIAAVITKRTGIPAFYFATNGTHSYVYGAGIALEKIADYYVKGREDGKGKEDGKGTEDVTKSRFRVNLLGVTPLDFSVNGTVESMKAFLCEEGFDLISCMAMGSSLSDIARAAQADVNLVVSSVGLPAAKLLERKFGIPYVVGTPIGPFGQVIATSLRQAAESGKNEICCTKRPDSQNAQIAIVGEAVVSGSLAAAIYQEKKVTAKVICPLEAGKELFVPGDEQAEYEEELERLFQDVSVIVADPMYRPICSEKVRFYEMPHEAFSGRIYREEMLNLVCGLRWSQESN
ncbi:MAG: nitrogenase component 1 [Lachnospiraceae bacterium]|nr:nitrogenase component 1 [Lachnospiraceae bacterium]